MGESHRMLRRGLIIVVALTVLFSVCTAVGEQDTWDCPECGRKGNTGKFCGNCAHEAPKTVKVGDIVRFGHYEQDNKKSTGKEAIEWIVLAVNKKEKKALLLSRYVLATRPYINAKTNAAISYVSWKKSDIRKWLNDTFIQDAFNSKERKAILSTRLNNGFGQQRYDRSKETAKGSNTTDKLFLLSYKEVYQYVKTTQRAAKATPQAIARGTWTALSGEYKDRSVWLTRATEIVVEAVDLDGGWTGVWVNRPGAGIRPALWVDTSSGLLK